MLVLVKLTISAKFGRIINSGIHSQSHIIEYLTVQDSWVILKNRKIIPYYIDNPFISVHSHIIWFI